MPALDAELYSDAMGRMHASAVERYPDAEDKRFRFRPNFTATVKGLEAAGKSPPHRATLKRWWEGQSDADWERFQGVVRRTLHTHDPDAVAAAGARLQMEGMFRVAMQRVAKAMEDTAQWDELNLLLKVDLLVKLGKAAEYARGLNPELVGAVEEGEDKGSPEERAGKVLSLWRNTQGESPKEEG